MDGTIRTKSRTGRHLKVTRSGEVTRSEEEMRLGYSAAKKFLSSVAYKAAPGSQ